MMERGGGLGVDIVPVQTREQWHEFHHLPYQVYRDDPHWIPPLLLERKFHFNPKHNPFFQHARAAFWLAYQDGRPVGRISAQIDQLHLDRYADASGHFGFLEAIDDAAVFEPVAVDCRGLAAQRRDEARDRPGQLFDVGSAGPARGGIRHSAAGDDGTREAVFRRPYRGGWLSARAGSSRLRLRRRGAVAAAAVRVIDRIQKRSGISVRRIRNDKAHIDGETALIFEILNDAWSDNWGFVPMTQAEFADLVGVLKHLLRDGDVAFAEYQGRPSAFAIIMPNLNEAIRDLGGRLAPFGWLKLLWRLKVSGIRTGRMPLMGVRKALQGSPVGAALALSVIQATRAFNIENGRPFGELSWVLDQNERVRHIIELVGAKVSKRYRIYEKELDVADRPST